MSTKVKDPSRWTFKLAILASTMLTAGVGLGSVFLPSLRQAYPGISDVMLKSFVSLPNAAQLLALILVGWMANKWGKRNVLMFSCILFTVSGILPIFVKDFMLLLVGRLFLGFSVGIAQPLGTALLADYYTHQERNDLMGYQSALGGFGNMALTFIAGLFLATSWRWGFIVYLLGLVIFVLLWLFVSDDHQISPKKENKSKPVKKLKLV